MKNSNELIVTSNKLNNKLKTRYSLLVTKMLEV